MLSLFPSCDLDALKSEDLKEIALIHPRTGSPAKFLLNVSNRKLYEIQTVSRGTLSNGSFLVDPGYLVPRTDLSIYSQVDPFLLILEPLLATPVSQFVDYIDCMNGIIERSEKCAEGMATLVQSLNASPNFKSLFVDNFCESRTVMDRCLVRIDRGKVVAWLVGKVETVTEYMKKSNIYLVETASNVEQFSKLAALELLRAYVNDDLLTEMVKVIGYDTDSLFGAVEFLENDLPQNGGVKRPAAASTQPAAKKMKEMAIAKSCMKMTAFFKPKS